MATLSISAKVTMVKNSVDFDGSNFAERITSAQPDVLHIVQSGNFAHITIQKSDLNKNKMYPNLTYFIKNEEVEKLNSEVHKLIGIKLEDEFTAKLEFMSCPKNVPTQTEIYQFAKRINPNL